VVVMWFGLGSEAVNCSLALFLRVSSPLLVVYLHFYLKKGTYFTFFLSLNVSLPFAYYFSLGLDCNYPRLISFFALLMRYWREKSCYLMFLEDFEPYFVNNGLVLRDSC
jgi:hypothetical protein